MNIVVSTTAIRCVGPVIIVNNSRSGTPFVIEAIGDASTLEKAFEGIGSNKAAARIVGKNIAERAAAKGITEVVFDRGGYLYHGRVSELAEGAREGGLKF